MIRLLSPQSKLVFLACVVALAGCVSTSSSQSDGVDVDADGLYPVGSYRDDLERRFGRGAFYWIVNEVPADDYAAAYVKAMVSLRRPRPVAYEVFAQRSAAAGHALYYDYVFYGDGTRVLYVTRKTVN